jgi:hypothetical protein
MTERTAAPLCQSIELALTAQPDVKYKYGSGRIRPQRVVFYYLTDRINAHLYGTWVREDGEATEDPVDQDYRFDGTDWPGWLADMAREYDPRAKVAAPVDRAAVLREAADAVDNPALARAGNKLDAAFMAARSKMAAKLRRMADEAQQCRTPSPDRKHTCVLGSGHDGLHADKPLADITPNGSRMIWEA